MKQTAKTTSSLACPSIASIGSEAQVFGVVTRLAPDVIPGRDPRDLDRTAAGED
jgi:hypothetical protein